MVRDRVGWRWRIVLVAAVVVAFPVLAGGTADAQASSSCDQTLVDAAEVVDDPAALTQAAIALGQASGARVFVRTVSSMGGAAVETYERGLEAACPSWQQDGRRAPDLVVVLVAPTERKTGIYYGLAAKPRLDPVVDRVQSRSMNPLFKAGRFGDGLIAGLEALTERYDPAFAPTVSTLPADPPTTVARPSSSSSSRSSDQSVLWIGAAVLGLLVVAAVGWYRRSVSGEGGSGWDGDGGDSEADDDEGSGFWASSSTRRRRRSSFWGSSGGWSSGSGGWSSGSSGSSSSGSSSGGSSGSDGGGSSSSW